MKYLKITFLPVLLWTTLATASNSHIGLFLGITDIDSHTDFTMGLEYERRTSYLDGKTGFGLILDNDFADQNIFIIAFPFYYHPIDNLRLLIAPGYEFKDSGNGNPAKQKYLTKIGAGYDFHYEKLTYGPMLAFDFVDGGSIGKVFGFDIGLGF